MTRPFPRSTRPIPTLALFLAAACGGDADSARSGWSGTARDSAGIALVHNHRDPDRVAPFVLREVVRIEPDEARPETLFGYVADATLRADTILVLDQHQQSVRVFAPDGTLLRSLGGPGEGPGELTMFAASVLMDADTVLVADWGGRLVHRFEPDGTFVRASRMPFGAARSYWRLGGDSTVYVRAMQRFRDEQGAWDGADGLHRPTQQGDTASEVLAFDYEHTDVGAPGAARVPLVVNSAFWDVTPDGGILWGTLADGRIRVHAPDGELRRIVSHDAWSGTPVSEAGRQVLLDRMGERLEALGGSASLLDQLPVDVPEVLPAIVQVRAGPEGTIWVQRGGSARDVHPMALNTPDPPAGLGGPVWDVLDRDGRYQGSLELPDRFRMLRLTGRRILGVVRDELDAESVVVFALERAGG